MKLAMKKSNSFSRGVVMLVIGIAGGFAVAQWQNQSLLDAENVAKQHEATVVHDRNYSARGLEGLRLVATSSKSGWICTLYNDSDRIVRMEDQFSFGACGSPVRPVIRNRRGDIVEIYQTLYACGPTFPGKKYTLKPGESWTTDAELTQVKEVFEVPASGSGTIEFTFPVDWLESAESPDGPWTPMSGGLCTQPFPW